MEREIFSDRMDSRPTKDRKAEFLFDDPCAKCGRQPARGAMFFPEVKKYVPICRKCQMLDRDVLLASV